MIWRNGFQGWVLDSPNSRAFMLTPPMQFYDVQPTCPDLLTHLEDISWQYPTEPLERAMLRFFEAISKWRGKPELETVSPFVLVNTTEFVWTD